MRCGESSLEQTIASYTHTCHKQLQVRHYKDYNCYQTLKRPNSLGTMIIKMQLELPAPHSKGAKLHCKYGVAKCG